MILIDISSEETQMLRWREWVCRSDCYDEDEEEVDILIGKLRKLFTNPKKLEKMCSRSSEKAKSKMESENIDEFDIDEIIEMAQQDQEMKL